MAPPAPPTMLGGQWTSGRAARVLTPLVVLVAVAVTHLWTAGHTMVLGLCATVPLLASNLVGIELTGAYGVLSVLTGASLGISGDLYSTAEARQGQLIRLTGIILSSVVGVLAARRRLSREVHLLQMTRVAEVAQRAILAPIPHRLDGLALAEQYTSAATDALIGGDLYAAVDTPYGVRLLIGDVRGKGLEAVRLASYLLGTFRERAEERADLLVLLADLDRAVRRIAEDEDFVTAVIMQIALDRTVTVVNAGHPAPLLVRHGMATALRPPVRCPPLGLSGECGALAVEVEVEVGDRLLLYTDGLGEARSAVDRTFFPLRRFAAPTLSSGSLEEGLVELQTAVRDWAGGALSDDVALLAVEVLSGRVENLSVGAADGRQAARPRPVAEVLPVQG